MRPVLPIGSCPLRSDSNQAIRRCDLSFMTLEHGNSRELWGQPEPRQRLDVPSLADRAALTERTFHRKFVAATGMTPARFVETARLDAARMLLSRGLSLKSVAAQVGLSPTARLSEAFERRLGVAPRLLRDMHAGL
jgi:transcriptional regulator GlxA family with amidase domain